MRKIKRYGWIPDVPDFRDRKFTMRLATLPASVDLRPWCPAVYDQGNLGSCTANAIAAALQFERKKQALTPDFVPSRLFIYYNERVIEGTVDSDAGAMIRDGIKSVGDQGACSEDEWPYDTSRFAAQPPDSDYTDALADRALQYERIDNTDIVAMQSCLAGGYPFVFGISVFNSFESGDATRTGDIPMPDPESEQLLGGHAMLVVGYDDSTSRFRFRNSWGTGWGDVGYGTIPYGYLTDQNLADDFWKITLVSQQGSGS